MSRHSSDSPRCLFRPSASLPVQAVQLRRTDAHQFLPTHNRGGKVTDGWGQPSLPIRTILSKTQFHLRTVSPQLNRPLSEPWRLPTSGRRGERPDRLHRFHHDQGTPQLTSCQASRLRRESTRGHAGRVTLPNQGIDSGRFCPHRSA